jgi:hypothetical protein
MYFFRNPLLSPDGRRLASARTLRATAVRRKRVGIQVRCGAVHAYPGELGCETYDGGTKHQFSRELVEADWAG